MTDREKVIEALQYMISEDCTETQFDYIDEIEAAISLLKEQEAVQPAIDEYGNKRCGSCGHKLQSIVDPDLFCCKCGKPVLWEGR